MIFSKNVKATVKCVFVCSYIYTAFLINSLDSTAQLLLSFSYIISIIDISLSYKKDWLVLFQVDESFSRCINNSVNRSKYEVKLQVLNGRKFPMRPLRELSANFPARYFMPFYGPKAIFLSDVLKRWIL